MKNEIVEIGDSISVKEKEAEELRGKMEGLMKDIRDLKGKQIRIRNNLQQIQMNGKL